MKIELIEVGNSSNVLAFGYDETSKTLQLNFKNGAYQFENVPPEKFAEMKEAESKGKYFSAQVKPFYFGHKLEEEQNDGNQES